METFHQVSKDLIRDEYERWLILHQCTDCGDVLDRDFRFDEICFAYRRFEALGLTLDLLFTFQKEVHRVIYPWNMGYDTYRQDVNRLFNVFPLLIIMAESECDVLAAYQFALKWKIPFRIRGGAHSFEGLSLINNGMIIDQSRRKKIKVERGVAYLEPGVLLGPLAKKVSKTHQGFVIGTCPNNGMGYFLGGGLGFFTRTYGVGSDNLLGLKVMLANGQVVWTDLHHHPDLFWACRGAGNNTYGIILELKLRLFPLKMMLHYQLIFSYDKIKEVMKTWLEWGYHSTIKLGSILRALNNKGNITIIGFYLGKSEKKLRKLLEPLIRIGPEDLHIDQVDFAEGVRHVSGIGRWLPFFKVKNRFIDRPFSEQALDVIAKYMGIGSGLDNIFLDVLGGVNDLLSPNDTAWIHRKQMGWFMINAHWDNQREGPEHFRWATDFYNELAPHLSFQSYQNSPDLEMDLALERYYGHHLKRLIHIKKKYDPECVFEVQQGIPCRK